jgi:hypothetical protein
MLKIYDGKTSPFQIHRSIPRRYLPSTPFENPKNLFSSTFISHAPSQTQNFSKDIIVISPTHESQNLLTDLKILSLSLSLSLPFNPSNDSNQTVRILKTNLHHPSFNPTVMVSRRFGFPLCFYLSQS